jgi:hypothetical protein
MSEFGYVGRAVELNVYGTRHPGACCERGLAKRVRRRGMSWELAYIAIACRSRRLRFLPVGQTGICVAARLATELPAPRRSPVKQPVGRAPHAAGAHPLEDDHDIRPFRTPRPGPHASPRAAGRTRVRSGAASPRRRARGRQGRAPDRPCAAQLKGDHSQRPPVVPGALTIAHPPHNAQGRVRCIRSDTVPTLGDDPPDTGNAAVAAGSQPKRQVNQRHAAAAGLRYGTLASGWHHSDVLVRGSIRRYARSTSRLPAT